MRTASAGQGGGGGGGGGGHQPGPPGAEPSPAPGAEPAEQRPAERGAADPGAAPARLRDELPAAPAPLREPQPGPHPAPRRAGTERRGQDRAELCLQHVEQRWIGAGAIPQRHKQGSAWALSRGAQPDSAAALTVRFITRRFIGDYDPTLEMIYRHVAVIDGEMVHFEILDTAGQEEDSLQIEEKIKWGDGFAVVYSVTDRCSFDEVMRLCFLINHLHASPKRSGAAEQPPVVIVGNKKDLQFDRMVSTEDGENLSKALKIPFYEISTRDSYEEPVAVFSSLYQELLRQGHFSPGSFKRRTVSKLMEKIPKMQASSTLNSAGRSLSFNSFRDYIPE
ncbi:ras-related and estrogen-regulated growth inhibitor-like isoform X1 [Anomalospiza imberbis]|uniref:ras-related and estrogen-regulated growth inhibitor-like isoform X1 n=1 Tax=Anomalospiza imberbis TaxID=187417 RepID=UPI00358E8DC3